MKIAREVAVKEYNDYFLKVGIEKEDLIDVTRKDIIQVNKQVEDGVITEEEKEVEIEKRDAVREKIIKAFMKGVLSINDDGKMVMTPKYIPTTLEGSPLFTYLTFKERVTYAEEIAATKGVNQENGMELVFAKIAARVGMIPPEISKMDSKEVNILQAVEMVFLRAD